MNGDHPTAGDYAMAEASRNTGLIGRLGSDLSKALTRIEDLEEAVLELHERLSALENPVNNDPWSPEGKTW